MYITKKANTSTIQELKEIARKFKEERGWEKYHTPRNLAMDISVESSELLELFLWDNNEDLVKLLKRDKTFKQDICDELADVIHACLAFANSLDIDITTVFTQKIKKTSEKYPAEKVKDKDRAFLREHKKSF